MSRAGKITAGSDKRGRGGRILRVCKFVVWFGLMAGLGILVGCFIHGKRVNQPTIMSGVAFVRAFPYGEYVVGTIETAVFSYQEKKHLDEYLKEHTDIKINQEVLEKHKELYREQAPSRR